MKTLFLVRHAKSSWDDTALPDKDRPLNDRGKRDADYKVAAEKCDALSGSAKSTCISEAKLRYGKP